MSAQASENEVQLAHLLAARLDRPGREQEAPDDPPEMRALLGTFDRAREFVEDPQPEFYWRLGQALQRERESSSRPARRTAPGWWAALWRLLNAQPRPRLALAGALLLLLVLMLFGRAWAGGAAGNAVYDAYHAYSAVSGLDESIDGDEGSMLAAYSPSPGLFDWLAPGAAQPAAAPAGSVWANSAPATVADRMVIRRAALDLAVTDVIATQARLENVVVARQGLVVDAQSSRSSDGQAVARISIRVPQDALEATLADVRALGGTVLAERITHSDVTTEYADLTARIHNLQVTEGELLKLLQDSQARGDKVESIMAVYNSISGIRGQIEQLQAQQIVTEQSAAMAQIDVALLPEQLAPEAPQVPGFSPERVLGAAWAQFVVVLQWLVTGLIWLAVFLPLPLVVAGAAWIVYRARRRARRSRSVAADEEPGR